MNYTTDYLPVLLMCFLLFHHGSSSAQDSLDYGLLFQARPGEDQHQYAEFAPLELPEQFELSFHIRIDDPTKYGEIFRLGNMEHGSQILLVHVPGEVPSTSQLRLVLGQGRSSIEIKVPQWSDRPSRPVRFATGVDVVRNTVTAQVGNALPDTLHAVEELEFSPASLVFGPGEDPRMIIYEVEISTSQGTDHGEKLLYSWRLDEFDGTEARELNGGPTGRVVQLPWVRGLYLRWMPEISITLDSYPIRDMHPGKDSMFYRIGFNPRTSEVVVLDRDRVNIYSLRTGRHRFTPHGLKWTGLLLRDTIEHRWIMVQRGRGSVEYLDDGFIPQLGLPYTDPDSLEFHGAAYYLNPADGRLYSFGGYGHYAFKNTLAVYDEQSRRWEEISLDGDAISPRMDCSLIPSGRKNQVFLVGGQGSPTGRQSDGVRWFSDCYLVDIEERSAAILWEDTTDPPDHKFALLATVGRSRAHIGVRIQEGVTEFVVGDLETEKLLPLRPQLEYENLHPVPPVYDETTGKLVVFHWGVPGRHGVAISSLRYPPPAYLSGFTSASSSSAWILWLVAVLTILGAYGAARMLKRRGSLGALQSYRRERVSRLPERELNVVQVFGELRILDEKGEDAAKRLSPKQKELFLVLLLHSLGDGRDGIPADRLSSYLWPEASTQQAKNNRGVTVNRLRKALAATQSIEVRSDRHTWTVVLRNDMRCDLSAVLLAIDGISHPEPVEEQKVLEILSAGSFLDGLSYPWLDPISASISQRIIRYVESKLHKSDSFQSSHDLARILLLWEPLHEEGHLALVRSLSSMGRHEQAKSSFAKFVDAYQQSLRKEYPRTMQEVLQPE